MPDEDNNFRGYLGLYFRKWRRHVQATIHKLHETSSYKPPRIIYV